MPPPKATPNGEQHAVHVERLIGVAVKDLTRDNLKRFGTHDGLVYLFYRKMLNLCPFQFANMYEISGMSATCPTSVLQDRRASFSYATVYLVHSISAILCVMNLTSKNNDISPIHGSLLEKLLFGIGKA